MRKAIKYAVLALFLLLGFIYLNNNPRFVKKPSKSLGSSPTAP